MTASSDHSSLSFTFNTKITSYIPKKILLRNNRLLTKEALEAAFFYIDNIDSIFNTDDPDTITNIFFNEIYLIIDIIAPQKL